MPSTRPPKRRRARRRRRAGREHVVDEAHAAGSSTRHGEGATDIGPPLDRRTATLTFEPACAREERRHRHLPVRRQRTGQRLRGSVAPCAPTSRVGRHERKGLGGSGTSHDVGDEARGNRGEVAPSPLLPRVHEPPCNGVVGDGGPCGCEREPPSRAFHAAPHGPGARCATALAQRRRQPNERPPTRDAEPGAGHFADGAPLRQQEPPRSHGSTVAPPSSRHRAVFVPSLFRRRVGTWRASPRDLPARPPAPPVS